MTSNKLLLPFAALILAFTTMISSCNSESTTVLPYVEASSVAVNGFSLKADKKIVSGLDSVFFSIDLERGLIFNADSLPKGTKTTALIPIISLPSSVIKATITMDGGTHRTGSVDYLKNTDDSIDFSGRVALELISAEGNSKTYQIKVNVHQADPDTLWWGETAISTLPSRLSSPKEQRTVDTGTYSVASLIQESDDSYTFATSDDAFTGVWTKQQITLPFTPQVRTLTYCDGKFYMLAADGTLATSDTGYDNWLLSEQLPWRNILGAYNGSIIGITDNSGTLEFVSYPAGAVSGQLPDGFPVEGYSNTLTLTSKWWQKPMILVYGGKDAIGNYSANVWAYDGYKWAVISNGDLPALSGAAIIPYFAFSKGKQSWTFNEYSILMMLGGQDKDGNANKSMYISYDNGVCWQKASDELQLPAFIPGMHDLDAIVASTPMTGDFEPKGWSDAITPALPPMSRINYSTDGYKVNWDCPFIYLYGGRNDSGALYNSVWRGVIRRLTFTPLI